MPGRGDAGWRSHEVRVAFLYRTSREAAAGSGRPGAGCGADIVCAQKSLTTVFFFLRSSGSYRLLVEAGRVELPSEKGPRKASTGLVCVQGFRLGTCPQTGIRRLSRRDSSRTPRKEQTYASPMSLAPRRRIGRRPLRRDGLVPSGCLTAYAA